MNCNWEGVGPFKCSQCGETRAVKVLRACKATPADGGATVRTAIPLARKAWEYSKAVATWVAAGQPTRSQAEIDEVLAVCRQCENYRETAKSHCIVCGCSLNRAANGLVNKIAMATEHCPLTPPKW